MLPFMRNERLFMKEKIEHYLHHKGYKKLSAATSAFTIYFAMQNGYVTAVMLVDLQQQPDVQKDQYDSFRQKTTWRFVDGGSIEVHMLSVILTDELDRARALNADDRFSWVILCAENRLVIEEEKAEDFYGMKKIFETCLTQEPVPDTGQMEPLEYDAKGQPFYKDIRQRPLVNHALFVLNALVFTMCMLSGNLLYDMGVLSYQKVLDGEWYRVFTSMFLHADMSHIVGNMLILYYLGDIVERAMGHVRYLLVYLLSGILSGFASMYFSYLTQDYLSSLGASGAIFGMVGALLWITLRNHGHIEIMTVRKVLFLIGYSLYMGFTGTNVDNAAHVGGLISGFLLAVLFYHKKEVER